MLKVFKETTRSWSSAYANINHTYLLSGDRIVAYKPRHCGAPRALTHPKLKLDRARRTFEELVYDPGEWLQIGIDTVAR